MHTFAKQRGISSSLLIVVALFLALVNVSETPRALATETQISEGSVTWGIKDTWRRYIGNGVTLSDGVTTNEAGEYVWPIRSGVYDADTKALTLYLGGEAHFQAYPNGDGTFILDSTFKNPVVEISQDQQTIFMDYVGVDRETFEPVVGSKLPMANLDLSSADFQTGDGFTSWSRINTFGTGEGGLYEEGTPYDFLSIEYAGEGGIPNLETPLLSSASPELHLAASWYEEQKTQENNRLMLPSYDSGLVYSIEKSNWVNNRAGGSIIVRAHQYSDLSVIATAEFDLGVERSFKYALDESTNSIFFVDGQRSVNDAGVSEVDFSAFKIVFDTDAGAFHMEEIADLIQAPRSSDAVSALSWDAEYNRLAVVMTRLNRDDRRDIGDIYYVTENEQGWKTESQDLYLDASFEGIESFSASSNADLISNNESRYLYSPGGSYRMNSQAFASPLFTIEKSSDSAIIRAVEGSETNELRSVGFAMIDKVDDSSAWVSTYGVGYIQKIDLSGESPKLSGDVYPMPNNGFLRGIAVDKNNDILYAMPQSTIVNVLNEGNWVSSLTLSNVNRSGTSGRYPISVGQDGSLFLIGSHEDSGVLGIQRFQLDGVTPSIAEQPESHVIELGAGSSQEVTFAARAEGGTGEWAQQWQVKKPGESAFSNIDGATGETLTVAASGADNGSVYRATFTGEIGTVASNEATLTVNYAPKVATQPASKDVVAGTPSVFQAAFTAHPEVEDVYWEYRSNGFWTRINTDNNFQVTTAEGLTSLTVTDTAVDQSGTRLRAVAKNASGTTMSREAVLTVRPATGIPDDGLNIDDVVLRWGISEEVQSRPPFGDSNYLSAGVSDGSALTYESTDGDVRIIHSDGTTDTEPDYASRAAHVSDATIDQLVEFGGGNAAINPDGSATVDWDGSFSLNFYDGLVPFTITDPHLEVSAAGMGVLTGDLTGYEVEMSNPNEKTPLTNLYEDVTIATFSGVSIDPEGVVTITPDYDGVLAYIPVDVTPQVTTGAGWGAWPQGFLDFHFDTNLSSYWYSSGGAGDSKKAPMSFEVDFTNASDSGEQPGVPQASDLNAGNKGDLVIPAEAEVGQEITIGGLPAGEDVDVMLFPTTFSFDRMTVGADGTVTVIVPAGRGGENQLAVYEADKAGAAHVLGWSALTIAGQDAQDPDPQDPQDPDPQEPGVPGSSVGSAFDTLIKIVSRIFGGLSALLGLWFGGLFSS